MKLLPVTVGLTFSLALPANALAAKPEPVKKRSVVESLTPSPLNLGPSNAELVIVKMAANPKAKKNKSTKNARGKLSFSQKAKFKLKKFKINRELKNSQKLKVQSFETYQQSERVEFNARQAREASRQKLNTKAEKLNASKNRAANMSGLSGILARFRVGQAEKSLMRGEQKHFNGPKTAHLVADYNKKNALNDLAAKNNAVNSFKSALVTRKADKNAARKASLDAANRKKAEKMERGRGKLPQLKPRPEVNLLPTGFNAIRVGAPYTTPNTAVNRNFAAIQVGAPYTSPGAGAREPNVGRYNTRMPVNSGVPDAHYSTVWVGSTLPTIRISAYGKAGGGQ